MDIEFGVRSTFGGTHRRCDYSERPHGHFYEIEVFVTGEVDRIPESRIREEVAMWAASMNFQDLDAVLPGVVTTAVGIAAHLLMHATARFPKTTEVIVRDMLSNESGRARRTPRAL